MAENDIEQVENKEEREKEGSEAVDPGPLKGGHRFLMPAKVVRLLAGSLSLILH